MTLNTTTLASSGGSVSKTYQHWADGDALRNTAAEWNNNILSDTKSDYFEGEVVPHVFVYKASNSEPLVQGKSYTFNITYNHYQANTNAGGFLYMTTPDLDRTPVPLLGTASAPDAGGFVNGGGMLGNFRTVNADVTAVSAVNYTTAGGGTQDGKVSVTFVYTGPTTTSGNAEIHYGLMVAAPGQVPDQGKGPTMGATAWTGGSLQTTVDVNGSGAMSLQLSPSAILAGEISGMKFNDFNGDGARDANGLDNILGTADDESGLSGWTIFIDRDNDGTLDPGEVSTVTGKGGTYSFSVTPDADPSDPDNDPYLIREVQQTGWHQTTANPAPILISAADPREMNVNFGNQEYRPSLNILKDASVPGGTADAAGEVIAYSITVQNTGNQTLTSVVVSDPFVSDLTRIADASGDNDGLLEVGETWRYSATHTVTQAEIDAGAPILNVSTADTKQTDPASDDASVPVAQAPAIAVDKAIERITGGNNNSSADFPGDVLNYTVTVYNPGNVTLTNVTLVDPLTGLNMTGLTLAPGAAQTYPTQYVLTQADLDDNGGGDGYLDNTATADSLQTDAVSDTEKTELLPRPSLGINKTLETITGGNGNVVADAAGDRLNYTVTVSNEGNVTLTSVSVVDPRTSLNVSGLTLAPGDSRTYTTEYVLTQADIDSNGDGDGYFDNTVTADSDQTPALTDSESEPLLRTIGLGVNKSVTGITGGNGNVFADWAGDVLNYSITITNQGTVTLTNVSVADLLTGFSQSVASLAPGASQTYTTSYSLTQKDLDGNGDGRGYIENIAEVDSDQTEPARDNETVQLIRSAVLVMDKHFIDVTGGNGNNQADAAGDSLNYSITVSNPGNVTLTDVSVVEPMTGFGVTGVTLAPGASATYLTNYVLRQADLDDNGGGDGYIDNTATADSSQTGPVNDVESVPLLRSIGMAFDKQVLSINGGNGNNLADAAGDVITYRFIVTNPGTVTLTGLTVKDPLTGLDESLATLAPSTSQVFTSTYTVTQNDLDTNAGGDGRINNVATADSNETPPFTDAEAVTVVYDPRIDLVKWVSVDNGVTWVDANSPTGPTLSSTQPFGPLYKFSVTNTGNITLPGVSVTDSVYDLNNGDPGRAHAFGTLLPGDTLEWVFSGAVYQAGQQSDIAVATVTGMPSVTDADNAYYFGA